MIRQRAPGHYPCGPIAPGENMAVSPGLGWSNSLPDSEARVEFVLNGTALSFTGAGYHDQVRKGLVYSFLKCSICGKGWRVTNVMEGCTSSNRLLLYSLA